MYRKFKIKHTDTQNDPLCMAEVIKRRIGHLEDWGTPDLILLDGGKTQLGAVNEVLKQANLEALSV